MHTHVCRTLYVFSCFAALRQLRSIRHHATVFQSLVATLVFCWLDYGKVTLVGLPAYLVHWPQSVQNAAARLVFHLRRSDHITDAFVSLHLAARARTDYFQHRRAGLSSSPWRCPAVPTAVHTDRRNLVSTKTAVFFVRWSTHDLLVPAVRLLQLDVAPSLSPALAHGTTYRSMSPQHHLCSPSAKRLKLHLFRLSYPGLVL